MAQVMNPELYRLFFEEASDALLAVSLPDGKVQALNRNFQMVTGFTHDEILGESVALLSSSLTEEYARERKLDLSILDTAGFYNDLVLSTKDGNVKFVSVKVRHVTLENKTLALAVVSDDTERQFLIRDLATKHQSLEQAFADLEQVHEQLKASQERMAQSAKLAALGELSAGLSHELNQPLTGVRGFAQEILDMLKTEPKPSKKKVKELLREIVLNSDKMANLLSHFRSFARKERKGFENGEAEPSHPVNMVDVYQSVTKLLGRQFGNHGIELTFKNSAKDNATAWALPHPIEQILINLLSNSRDAVIEKAKDPAGSRAYKPKVSVELSSDRDNVILSISDNGSGVPESIRGKIFDPFFTTKDPGKGTGLGLAISYGIAHRFGGELFLSHSSPNGTTFTLKLPRHAVTQRKAA